MISEEISAPSVFELDEGEFAELRPGITGVSRSTEQLTVNVYRYTAGSSWEEHSHPEDQLTFCEAGTIEFTVGGEPVVLSAGQMAVLPGGVLHSAKVADDGETVETINVWRRRESRP